MRLTHTHILPGRAWLQPPNHPSTGMTHPQTLRQLEYLHPQGWTTTTTTTTTAATTLVLDKSQPILSLEKSRSRLDFQVLNVS